MQPEEPTKSAVRKAGSTIRKFARQECSVDDFNDALDIITAYRAGFTEPLSLVHSSLNYLLDPDYADGKASHRLKKIPTIVDKLSREPGLDLSRMQDIGGCRVVFPEIEDLRYFEGHVRRVWDGQIKHERDYIVEPRESGYRGVHLIVQQHSKVIEIQLRTSVMHTWAELVEAFSAVTRENFKQDGSHVVQEFMKLNARIGANEEGLAVPPLSEAELDRLAILKGEVEIYLVELRNELERKR